MQAKHRSALAKTLAILVAVVVAMLVPLVSSAADFLPLPDGSKVDLGQKCPVCGMVIGGTGRQAVTVTFKDGHVTGFHGVAAAVFKDGHVVGFEGARCLFIYNSVPQKYHVNVADIAHQYVTDYTSKKMIDLAKAFLVLGSNVKGPMGYDLVPFSSKEEAAKFASENDGKWIVQLHEVAKAAQEGTDRSGPTPASGTTGVTEKRAPVPVQSPDQIKREHRVPEKPVTPPVRPQGRNFGPSASHKGGC
ncbi:MAG: nitrous oxide reductase accessory protein NosL [Desulfomonilaceae bacterium]